MKYQISMKDMDTYHISGYISGMFINKKVIRYIFLGHLLISNFFMKNTAIYADILDVNGNIYFYMGTNNQNLNIHPH